MQKEDEFQNKARCTLTAFQAVICQGSMTSTSTEGRTTSELHHVLPTSRSLSYHPILCQAQPMLGQVLLNSWFQHSYGQTYHLPMFSSKMLRTQGVNAGRVCWPFTSRRACEQKPILPHQHDTWFFCSSLLPSLTENMQSKMQATVLPTRRVMGGGRAREYGRRNLKKEAEHSDT